MSLLSFQRTRSPFPSVSPSYDLPVRVRAEGRGPSRSAHAVGHVVPSSVLVLDRLAGGQWAELSPRCPQTPRPRSELGAVGSPRPLKPGLGSRGPQEGAFLLRGFRGHSPSPGYPDTVQRGQGLSACPRQVGAGGYLTGVQGGHGAEELGSPGVFLPACPLPGSAGVYVFPAAWLGREALKGEVTTWLQPLL